MTTGIGIGEIALVGGILLLVWALFSLGRRKDDDDNEFPGGMTMGGGTA